ncbi:MAG: hypothetical protein WCO03_03015 [bacterium]
MKNKITTFILAISSSFIIPVLALAAAPSNFKELIGNTIIKGILKPVIPLLIGLAVVLFIYGILVVTFSDGGKKAEEGKQYMLWGIIGIFVMVSVWGLVQIVIGTFGLNLTPPTIQISVPSSGAGATHNNP